MDTFQHETCTMLVALQSLCILRSWIDVLQFTWTDVTWILSADALGHLRIVCMITKISKWQLCMKTLMPICSWVIVEERGRQYETGIFTKGEKNPQLHIKGLCLLYSWHLLSLNGLKNCIYQQGDSSFEHGQLALSDYANSHSTQKCVFGQVLFILWQDGVCLDMPGLASVASSSCHYLKNHHTCVFYFIFTNLHLFSEDRRTG